MDLRSAVSGGLTVPVRIKTTLYRLMQESLANVYRHARGAGVRIDLRADTQIARLTVADTGPGFEVTQGLARRRLGLNGMRQRVESQGGAFRIDSAPGQGTTIRVELQLQRNEGESPDQGRNPVSPKTAG